MSPIIYMKVQGEYGDTLNYISSLPNDLSEYGIGVANIIGTITRKEKRVGIAHSPLYLCCDIIESSHVTGNSRSIRLPVLRQIITTKAQSNNVNVTIPKILYFDIIQSPISNIRLYLTDGDGEKVAFSKCDLTVTLLFAKKKW